MNSIWKIAIAATTGALTGLLLVPVAGQAGPNRLCNPNVASIVGTNGPDVLRGTENTDWITGLGGADVISGLGGDDVICGGRGQDVIYAHDKTGFSTCKGDGPERLEGGQGNDKVYGGGPATLMTGGGGDDLLVGCGGFSMADYSLAPGPVDVRLWKGIAKGWGTDTLRGINVVTGSVYRDILVGSEGPDDLRGNEGNDFIKGLGGSDELWGYLGDDEIRGDDGVAGNDTLNGQDGSDSCLADTDDVKYDCES